MSEDMMHEEEMALRRRALEAVKELLAANAFPPPISTLEEAMDFMLGRYPSRVYEQYEKWAIELAAKRAGLS